MYVLNATRHLMKTLQCEIRQCGPSVDVIGGYLLNVLVKLLHTVMAATKYVQITFYRLTFIYNA